MSEAQPQVEIPGCLYDPEGILPSLRDLLALYDPEMSPEELGLSENSLRVLRECAEAPDSLKWPGESPKPEEKLVPAWFPHVSERRRKFEAALKHEVFLALGGNLSEWRSLSDGEQRPIVGQSLVSVLYGVATEALTIPDLL